MKGGGKWAGGGLACGIACGTRCTWVVVDSCSLCLPFFTKVTTVDKYQGQQNDYVLLSLVRTRIVGHLRDVRRLVVAMSRAR